jgi:hypothetical protein
MVTAKIGRGRIRDDFCPFASIFSTFLAFWPTKGTKKFAFNGLGPFFTLLLVFNFRWIHSISPKSFRIIPPMLPHYYASFLFPIPFVPKNFGFIFSSSKDPISSFQCPQPFSSKSIPSQLNSTIF